MRIPPNYSLSADMLTYISHIDANRQVIASINPSPAIIEKIQRVSILKSSLFSARIEGSRVEMQELDQRQKEQVEIFNILKAIEYIGSKITPGKRITRTFILKLHEITMNGVAPDGGYLRTEVSAIFNQAGVAVYVTPPPELMLSFLDELLIYINKKDSFPLITACMAHLIFEKIHPFIDGNGRVGRLLIYTILKAKGYEFGIHVPFEEYLDNHRETFYYYLDIGMKEPDEYLLFMLKAFFEQTEEIKRQCLDEMNKKDSVMLPPRQEEVFMLIKDHRMLSFDSIRRRFGKIPERTLRYDLKKLTDMGLVEKIGKTKGSYYCEKKKDLNKFSGALLCKESALFGPHRTQPPIRPLHQATKIAGSMRETM